LTDSSHVKEYYTALKHRTMLVLQQIAGEDRSAEIEKIELALLSLIPPKNYAGATGAEVELVKAYERTCAILSQHIGRNPKRLTVLEFYETLGTLKKETRKYEYGKPDQG
jgi:hypothetical protein